jgi:carbon storage regulator
LPWEGIWEVAGAQQRLFSCHVVHHQGVNGMLVLSRKPGERILVGNDVVITIVRIGPNTVRLGIDAPGHMNIVREELCDPNVIDTVIKQDHAPAAEQSDPNSERRVIPR